MESKFSSGDGSVPESKFVDKGESKCETKMEEAPDPNEEFSEDCGIFGDDKIVAKLVDWWGLTLSQDINTFFADHCSEFSEEEEHKLVYTTLHKQYEEIVEAHLREFVDSHGLTQKDLYRRLREATEANELAKMVVQLVLSCSDYGCFVDIMRAKARQQRVGSGRDEERIGGEEKGSSMDEID